MKKYYIFGVAVLSALLIVFGVFYIIWPDYENPHGAVIDTPNGPMRFSGDSPMTIYTVDGKTEYLIRRGKLLKIDLTEDESRDLWKLNDKTGQPFDTTALITEIDSLFPGDSVLKIFGPGMQTWYVSSWSSYYRIYHPDLSNYQSGVKSMIHITSRGKEAKYGVNTVFERVSNKKQIFKKSVALGLYLIRKGVDNNGKVTYPTTVTEVSTLDYRPIIDKNYRNENIRFDYFFTSIIGGYDELAKRIEYPEAAKRYGITGRVVIRVYLDEEGYVKGTQLLKAIGYGCEEAALKAVRKVRFHPTPDKKVNIWIVPVDFNLEFQNEGFDLVAGFIQYDHSKKMLAFKYANEGTQPVPSSKYHITAYVDDKLIFGSSVNHTLAPKEEARFYVQYEDDGKEHVTSLFIDPDNALREKNRNNNNFSRGKGKF